LDDSTIGHNKFIKIYIYYRYNAGIMDIIIKSCNQLNDDIQIGVIYRRFSLLPLNNHFSLYTNREEDRS
jgi:hypothetical protein